MGCRLRGLGADKHAGAGAGTVARVHCRLAREVRNVHRAASLQRQVALRPLRGPRATARRRQGQHGNGVVRAFVVGARRSQA